MQGRILVVLGLLVVSTAVAHADVFSMPSGQASLEFVTVGDPGNAPDTRYNNISVGAVAYTYAIGKYDVTAGQYCEFLNAVAKTDTYAMYNTYMDTANSAYGCNIKRSGTSSSYSYSVASDWANRPVNWVSWSDAARFANWLQNGQPTFPIGTSGEVAGSTETGAYTLNGATSDANLMAVSRNLGATWWVPSEDEWYKAAYFDPNKPGGAGYWDYPTRSNAAPSNVFSTTGTNNANFYNSGYTIGARYYRTEVGAFAGSLGPYGTFDQGGNVWQWNDSNVSGYRGRRGGSWGGATDYLAASNRLLGGSPTYEDHFRGFRVASVASPGDANLDGKVDINDLSKVLTNYDQTGKARADGDFNNDGKVDINDLGVVLTNYDKSIAASAAGIKAIPEPSTIAILLAAAIGLLAYAWRLRAV
jgi:formylglycine-generating enzyme